MAKLVTIKDLEKSTGLKGRVIRRKLRAKGFTAPLVEGKGRYYTFEDGSNEHKRALTAVKPAPAQPATPAPADNTKAPAKPQAKPATQAEIAALKAAKEGDKTEAKKAS